ncbi:MAG TPA: M2 family metallopeptidase [Polyangia bacterium]|nr:M2 family metallopeptidase [Polyangia bacterium]
MIAAPAERPPMRLLFPLLTLLLALPATAADKPATRRASAHKTAAEKEAQVFLDGVTALLIPAATAYAQIDWTAATDATPEHIAERTGAARVNAALTGSKLIIDRTKELLARESELDELTVRQLRRLRLAAAENPATIPDIVARRVAAESKQTGLLDSYTFCLQLKPGGGGGCLRPITANQIDDRLRRSRDLTERQRVWTASKEIGRALRPGMVELQSLRNQVARAMGYSSYFALTVADYDMTVEEMMALLDGALEATRPLFDGLHCFARHTLAARFKRPAPKLIPAHWIGDRWAQTWPGLVEEVNLDALFKGAAPETIVKSAEGFYTSLGFPKLPASFWASSDLYPVPASSARKKNTHASAWHIDRALDVRSLMNVEPNAMWFDAAHHELGHVYYFLSYSTPEVPVLLRDGPNRAFHEAMGELGALASQQTPYLSKVGVLPAGKEPDPARWLLQSGLESIVLLQWAAGTMTHFERDLYQGELPAEQWQKRWWDQVAQFQGVAPPAARPAEACDACTKTHVNDDPARYYDYALATLIKFQLHDHICRQILKQDVRACDYAGSQAVGDFLRGIMKLGDTRDWRAIMKDATGEVISARALLEFYAPLAGELEKRNAGKDCSR